MKVLFITHYSEMFGANRSMLQLIIELKELNVYSIVLLPYSEENSDLKKELLKESIPYVEAPIRWIKHPNIWKVVANYLYAVLLYPTILSKLKRRDFDIIHTNSSVIGVGAYLSKILKTYHVWHLREFGDLDYNLKTPFGKWFQRYLYSGKNTFIAISNKIYDHFKPYIGNNSIQVIYNGIKPMKSNKTAEQNKLHFCVVGFLHKNKGQLEIIQALDIIINKRGISNLHLTIIGDGDVEYKNELLSYVKNNNLTSYIDFLGYRDDVTQILTQMDVGIMASAHEAFGRVTVEYLMAGLAVVASDGGANTEIIKDRETGLFYKSGDYNELANRMIELIEDRKLRHSLANNGQQYAYKYFSAKANASNIYAIYKNLLQSKE